MIKVEKVSAFSKDGKGGNPAGVVLEASTLTDKDMQAIAKNVGYSETAFVMPSEEADFKVRFFTPACEVDLCGHATIATFSTMILQGRVESGQIVQETKAGLLKLNLQVDGLVTMQQARPAFYEKPDGEEILRSLGLSLDAKAENLSTQVVSTGLRDIFIPLKSRAHLKGIKADFSRIKEISRKYDVSGYHVFTLDAPEGFTAACRNFAPLYDIPEESATGTSSGALAAYLWHNGVVKETEMKFIQGVEMGSPSEISARLLVDGNDIEEVWVGGKAHNIGHMDVEI